MWIDAREIAPETTLETDVCIVGAGAAGITLAREFVGHRLDVCMLESGGFELEAEVQALHQAENAGLPYFPLDENRQRLFGGTTNLWAGWCRPLDPIDFEKRDWVRHSGWPISRNDLMPYYARAQSVCELGPFDYEPDPWEKQLNTVRLPLARDRVETRIYQKSPPTKFGEVYRDELCRAQNVRILHHANAVGIEVNPTADRVTRIRAACLGGAGFWVKARRFVLAAGALENARLLLASNQVQPEGLGNGRDLVGRFFMEHLHLPSGTIHPARHRAYRTTLYRPQNRDAVGRLFLPEPVQEQLRLLNFNAMLEAVRTSTVGQAEGGPQTLAKRLRSLVRGDRRGVEAFRLHHTLEQAPNPESRVRLASHRDALGLPRLVMEWRLTGLERHTFLTARAWIREAFQQAGLGSLRIDPVDADPAWPPEPMQGMRGHHMGVTRMSSDPGSGVVNPHCQVHGINNLFVAGSGVFPTSGSGTPTYTIVALALRLADRLKETT